MKIRSVVVLFSIVISASIAFGKKSEPREYVEGKMVEISRDQMAGGLLAAMQGGTGSAMKFTYIIESKDGVYEAREYHNGTQIFKPLEINAGSPIMFRIHPKGRLIYVPVSNGEKTLEVVKFTPR